MTTTFVQYAPRRIEWLGVESVQGTLLKRYAVTCGDEPLDRTRFDAGLPLVTSALPPPATAEGRAGAAFLILHQGRGANYLVLAWWDRENELPIRVWALDDGAWRPARGGESVCVWDLEIIWFERQAWIDTALAGKPVEESVRAYGERWLRVNP